MTLPTTISGREFDKFIEDGTNGTSIKIYGVTSGTFTISGLKTGAVLEIPLDDVTWIEATTALVTDRAVLAVQNQSGNDNVILWRYDDPGLGINVGYRIEDGGFRNVVFASGASSKVYIKMLSGSGTGLVEEISPA